MDDQSRLYARWQSDGGISLCRMDTETVIAGLQGGSYLRFSPGGRFLLARGNDRFRAWDVSGREPRLVQQGEEYGFAFHPNGRHLLTAKRDGSFWLYDLNAPDHEPAAFVALPSQPHWGMAYDPAGKRLAVIRAGKAEILDARTGQVMASIPESNVRETPAWHPSGNYLALVCYDGRDLTIPVWDLGRMTRTAILKGCRSAVIHVAFTPGGDHLLSEGWEYMLRLWEWRTGRQILQDRANSNLNLDQHGRFLILDEGGVHLVELASGQEYRSFVAQSAAGKDVNYWVPVVHPEGRICAVTMSDCIRLFDLETGDELAAVPQMNFRTAFQTDGALLVIEDYCAGRCTGPIQAAGNWDRRRCSTAGPTSIWRRTKAVRSSARPRATAHYCFDRARGVYSWAPTAALSTSPSARMEGTRQLGSIVARKVSKSGTPTRAAWSRISPWALCAQEYSVPTAGGLPYRERRVAR
jgi:hypothetical protein